MRTRTARRRSRGKLRSVHVAVLFALLASGCGSATSATSQKASDADLTAIRQTASDYIDGWYAGDAGRMERSLHDQLSKRWIDHGRVETTTKLEMVSMTKGGGGQAFVGDKESAVTVLDVYRDIAVVRCVSPEYVDYLQMGKLKGSWKIINVLWRYRLPE